ncbi:hypothetical protein ACLOJK_001690 [Asimina triloba]
MGPVRGFKRKRRERKAAEKDGAGVSSSSAASQQESSADWWEEFSKRITGTSSLLIALRFLIREDSMSCGQCSFLFLGFPRVLVEFPHMGFTLLIVIGFDSIGKLRRSSSEPHIEVNVVTVMTLYALLEIATDLLLLNKKSLLPPSVYLLSSPSSVGDGGRLSEDEFLLETVGGFRMESLC